jgi:hypothetical protein
MKGRLLVLSYYAAPELAVGGLRWTGLCRHMAERGWEVRLITASPGAETVLQPEGMSVVEVHRRTTFQEWYWERRAREESATSGTPPRPALGPEKGSRTRSRAEGGAVRAIRANLGDLMLFPDVARGWLVRAARATTRQIEEWKPDAVISTGPPHSVHLAAALGLGRRQVPWIVDLRDPWATPRKRYPYPRWSVALNRLIEAKSFERASAVLTTTPELGDALKDRFPDTTIRWLPNGVDTRELPQRSSPPSPGLVITHLGTVYFNRDPTPVLRAFARFLAAHPAARSQGSRVQFVGKVSGDFRRGLDQAVEELGLGEQVEMTGVVERPRALTLLAESHMALVLAQGQSTMVPAKLYEAVGMGLPTLVVTEPDSATGREGGRLGAAVHSPEDEAGMAAAMAAAWLHDGKAPSDARDRVGHARLAIDLEEIIHAARGHPVEAGAVRG